MHATHAMELRDGLDRKSAPKLQARAERSVVTDGRGLTVETFAKK